MGNKSCLNEYMKICANKRSRLLCDPCMTILNISSKATEPIVTKFHEEPPGVEEAKVCSIKS